ncbi:MAG: aminoacyl-tRNA hydrolase [Candidatus Shikimatogenerans bostrichidophilus]|nr:MAG: aminoacyl-tRNA hydrolase [Candidatus Shikimatogenerans bostrichidophilus]
MEKFLIIGLGNPIESYKNTRHNIGTYIVKMIINNERIKKKFKNKYGEIFIKKNNNKKYLFLLSNLYMNKIGYTINYFLKKYKLKNKNLIVLSDDIYIDFGKIKLKYNGGSGGHNGLNSIQNILKTKKYLRIKIGIGHNFKYGEQNKYVLSPMNLNELRLIKKKIYIEIYNLIFNIL